MAVSTRRRSTRDNHFLIVVLFPSRRLSHLLANTYPHYNFTIIFVLLLPVVPNHTLGSQGTCPQPLLLATSLVSDDRWHPLSMVSQVHIFFNVFNLIVQQSRYIIIHNFGCALFFYDHSFLFCFWHSMFGFEEQHFTLPLGWLSLGRHWKVKPQKVESAERSNSTYHSWTS